MGAADRSLGTGTDGPEPLTMKPEQIYQELCNVAEKLGVTVSEQSFRATGIPVRSGFCLIKGVMHCIIDKNIALSKKAGLLAQVLAGLPHENLYMVPAVRDFISRSGKGPQVGQSETAATETDP